MRRALATVAAGGLLIAAALVFGTAPLFVAGVGFALVGAVTMLWMWLATRGVRLWRQLGAERVVEGHPLQVTITLRRGLLGLPAATLLEPLARGPIVISRPPSPIRGQRELQVYVQARFERRGRRLLAPPALHVSDPLRLVGMRLAGSGAIEELLVLPRTEPIRWSAGARGPDARALHDGGGGEPAAAVDVDGLRPYRPGTPASRIHWPAYARGAGLIERRLRADAESRPLVVLDARVGDSVEPLDVAVRAAASLTLALARAGGCRLLVGEDRRPVPVDRDLRSWPAMHARLALVEPAQQG